MLSYSGGLWRIYCDCGHVLHVNKDLTRANYNAKRNAKRSKWEYSGKPDYKVTCNWCLRDGITNDEKLTRFNVTMEFFEIDF